MGSAPAFKSPHRGKSPVSLTEGLSMASSKAIFGRLAEFFLVYNIIIGWFIVYLTECHASLIYAWLVCLCDVVFLANVLGKWRERGVKILPFASAGSTNGVGHVGPLLQIGSALAFVPYHILFILELDGPGSYALICLLRLLWVTWTQSDDIRKKILDLPSKIAASHRVVCFVPPKVNPPILRANNEPRRRGEAKPGKRRPLLSCQPRHDGKTARI